MAAVGAAVVVLLVVGSLTLEIVRLIRSAESRGRYLATFRAVRWWMVPAGIAQLALVYGVMFALTSVAPALWFGWWALLGGGGNIMLGQTGREGLWWQMAAFAVPLSLIVLMPGLTYAEEFVFRFRCEEDGWARRIARPLLFGMVHCLVGVPIAAGLALTVKGWYLQQIYLTAIRRMAPEFAAAEAFTEPERQPFPVAPRSPERKPEAWAAYWREFDTVTAENRRRVKEWIADRPEREAAQQRRTDKLRERALVNLQQLMRFPIGWCSAGSLCSS